MKVLLLKFSQIRELRLIICLDNAYFLLDVEHAYKCYAYKKNV